MSIVNPRDWLRMLRNAWTALSVADRIALGVVILRVALWILWRSGWTWEAPGFLSFLFFLAAAYLLLRFLAWWRTRLLWSLRNRLIVAYVFIAVVPILLLVTMVVISAEILYSQLGAYIFWDELRTRVEMLSDAGEHLVAVESAFPSHTSAEAAEAARRAQVFGVHDRDLPGLVVDSHANAELFKSLGQPGADSFSGIVQVGHTLELMALRRHATPQGQQVVSLIVPVTPAFLETLAPDLGPIQLLLTRPALSEDEPGISYRTGNGEYREEGTRIGTQKREFVPPAVRWDFAVNGISNRMVALLEPGSQPAASRPVLAVFATRVSRLNRRVFSSLGELGGLYLVGFVFVGIVFFVLEIAALITGIVLTRTITKAVAELYRATQHVQSGDLSHRVRIERKDQLGVLGESFNLMTGSISNLIEEQRERQKLDNELSIAREVQAQLFPQKLPAIPGVHLQAICRAARVVSGDYYDFLQLGPGRLGMAIADISGKGISAALLMASLQAALRSQVMTSGGGNGGTAELVARLNRHLFLNTGDDRFATLFYAEYDCASRTLTYTNAGHLPPLYIAGGKVQTLEKGGIVLGVVHEYPYEEGRIHIEPGSLVIGYSDGLVEPENVYGEEFGIKRMAEAAVRLRNATPQDVAESLMQAAEEWAGTPEQADDMTVIVARVD